MRGPFRKQARTLLTDISLPGLLTNIGMVVANPAYDRNTTNIEVLNRGAYHGTVIWSVFRNVEYGVRGSGFSPEFGTFLGLGSKA